MALAAGVSAIVLASLAARSEAGAFAEPPDVPIVFVSRAILPEGSIYWDVPAGMPGVGTYSRFASAGPGRLMVWEPGGATRTLVDGANPTAESLHLVDANAPDVSWDAQWIVFAGLANGASGDANWRLYAIRPDGTGLRKITYADQNLDLSRFGAAAGGLSSYGDTDPVWLPDGRIVFSSTRWPSYAQYSGVRTSNLYVVNDDGTGLKRITHERNGADRPIVDPVTGKIVYARWWRNHRFPINSMETIPHGSGTGYVHHLGLTGDRVDQLGGGDYLWRNSWQAATINPDGTGLALWSASFADADANHVYGGAFAPDGSFVANYFPMANMTEAAGFGGLRRYQRGPGRYQPILGVTYLTLDYVHPENPTSYGIFNGEYASEPEVLPNGAILYSHAADVGQDYGLRVANFDGSGSISVYDMPGRAELRARAIRVRPVPPILEDLSAGFAPSLLPPTAEGPYDADGVFAFESLNVYFNAPVDAQIVSAMPVGSAGSIRFFLDHQRTSPGSFPHLDWPILLGERPVDPDGFVLEMNAPAGLPLFEQIRTLDGNVPFTGAPGRNGAGHVAGMNFGMPGTAARCVGCHVGHTMIPVPETREEARWTNLAPGAQVAVSSSRDPNQDENVVDRRVMLGEIWRNWTSADGQTNGEWVRLTFPVPVVVRNVRLYNTRQGDEANSTIRVEAAKVRLFGDEAGALVVAEGSTGQLSVSGTDVPFPDVPARVVLVEIDEVTGTFYGLQVASLGEIEVIARGGVFEAPSGDFFAVR